MTKVKVDLYYVKKNSYMKFQDNILISRKPIELKF